jgi:hypothetical protein
MYPCNIPENKRRRNPMQVPGWVSHIHGIASPLRKRYLWSPAWDSREEACSGPTTEVEIRHQYLLKAKARSCLSGQWLRPSITGDFPHFESRFPLPKTLLCGWRQPRPCHRSGAAPGSGQRARQWFRRPPSPLCPVCSRVRTIRNTTLRSYPPVPHPSAAGTAVACFTRTSFCRSGPPGRIQIPSTPSLPVARFRAFEQYSSGHPMEGRLLLQDRADSRQFPETISGMGCAGLSGWRRPRRTYGQSLDR